jgi:sodium transport system ATP-binding protein
MIRVTGLAKQFTSGKGKTKRLVQAVREVSFEARDGAITGLLGPNGAGKTTTMRMIAGLIAPDQGTIEVDGIDGQREPEKMLARLGVLSDARGLYPRLTARENIAYYAELHGMGKAAIDSRIATLAQMLDIGALLDRRTEGFSQGERMKTSLARAIVHDPQNLLLDEPTNGLDVLATRALRLALRGLRDAGKCVVISTHIMQEVERLCDQIYVVAHGTVVANDTVAGLKAAANEADFEEAFVKLAFAEVTK